ncbi:MAG: hypothetical protein P8X79_12135 [Reinekea sp.]
MESRIQAKYCALICGALILTREITKLIFLRLFYEYSPIRNSRSGCRYPNLAGMWFSYIVE